jgi:hypothetical protein
MRIALAAVLAALATTTGVVLALQYAADQPQPPAPAMATVSPEDVSVTFVVSQCTPGEGVMTDAPTIAVAPTVVSTQAAVLTPNDVLEMEPAEAVEVAEFDIGPLMDEMFTAIAPEVTPVPPLPLIEATADEAISEPLAEAVEPLPEPAAMQPPEAAEPAPETILDPAIDLPEPPPEPMAPLAAIEAPEVAQQAVPRVAPIPAPAPTFRRPEAEIRPPTPARNVTQISPSILLLH